MPRAILRVFLTFPHTTENQRKRTRRSIQGIASSFTDNGRPSYFFGLVFIREERRKESPPVTRHAPRRIPPAPASRGSCGPHSSSASRGSKFVTPRRRLWMPRHTDASHWPLRDGERNRTLAAFARFSYRSTNPREHHISLRSLCVVLGFSRSSAQPLSSMLRVPACDRRQLNSSLCAISLRRRCAFVCSVALRFRMRPEPCRMSLVGAQYERLCMLASFGM